MKVLFSCFFCFFLLLIPGHFSLQQKNAKVASFRNSIGMDMKFIPPGNFLMGSNTQLPENITENNPNRLWGDFDERPVHKVYITSGFYMSSLEVTNAQYELFDPGHRKYRQMYNFSTADDDAVIFVNWHEAKAFCDWLSKKENVTYRLPTEAEWEHACRAGTKTIYNTGDEYPKEYWLYQKTSWFPQRREAGDEPSLQTGRFPPNAFGLHDMHGNVEEWTNDWYDSYSPEDQKDPVGPEFGDFKVSRGGSHSTDIYYLRSANRMGTIPHDQSWYIGFRVVMGDFPSTPFTKVKKEKQHHASSKHKIASISYVSNDKPIWSMQQYVRIPSQVNDLHFPFPWHNHDSALAAFPNGDLLAIWYSTHSEPGRELGCAYSRFKKNSNEWESAKLFWNVPDRNDHAPGLFFDEDDGTLYHFEGLSAAATYGNLATIMRKSYDFGHTWSEAKIIFQRHGRGHMPVETVIKLSNGLICWPSDNTTYGEGTTILHMSKDGGETWFTPKGHILGIHGAVVELKNGSLFAVGRGNDINGKMAKSLSNDLGETWTYSASPFPGIVGGQRAVLLRLREGPILFSGFANNPLSIVDASGASRNITGLYTTLSFDEGNTWVNWRVVTDDSYGILIEDLDGHTLIIDYSHGEPNGYLSLKQGFDGMIHLISSRNHYQFNYKWLITPPPARP